MNLFTNPTFITTSLYLDSKIAEWDGLNSSSTSVSGDEFTSNGQPFAPRIVGGIGAGEGGMGPFYLANLIRPQPGESYTFTVLASSDAEITASIVQGATQKYGGSPVTLTTAAFTVDAGTPTTKISVAVTMPANYVSTSSNGLLLVLDSPAGTYIRIKEPWVNLTSLVPVEPDPEPEPEPEPEPVVDPLAPRVAAHIGRRGDAGTIEQASDHLLTVRAFVWGYTRGKGFEMRDIHHPVANLEAVIVSACTRLTANPEQLANYTAGDYSERGATLQGFTLPELAVLNGYRRRSA